MKYDFIVKKGRVKCEINLCFSARQNPNEQNRALEVSFCAIVKITEPSTEDYVKKECRYNCRGLSQWFSVNGSIFFSVSYIVATRACARFVVTVSPTNVSVLCDVTPSSLVEVFGGMCYLHFRVGVDSLFFRNFSTCLPKYRRHILENNVQRKHNPDARFFLCCGNRVGVGVLGDATAHIGTRPLHFLGF
jgi:hypothetical protein